MRKKELVITDFDDVAFKDWQKLFSASPNQSLQLFSPKVSNGKIVVTPSDEIFEKGELCWKNAIVAQFIRRIQNFSLFQQMVNVLLGVDGEVDIRPTDINLFIIQFPNCEEIGIRNEMLGF